jgi:hypothetical protein
MSAIGYIVKPARNNDNGLVLFCGGNNETYIMIGFMTKNVFIIYINAIYSFYGINERAIKNPDRSRGKQKAKREQSEMYFLKAPPGKRINFKTVN